MLSISKPLLFWGYVALNLPKVRGFAVETAERRKCYSSSCLSLYSQSTNDDETTPSTDALQHSGKEWGAKNVSILLCPAQFCVPADYDDILQDLRETLPEGIVSHALTVPLSRTDWIKVARQLPTKEFLTAELPVEETLRWYFAAIEQGIVEILGNSDDPSNVRICIIGHSIGGWVARAYLGGLSQSSTAVGRAIQEGNLVSSLITLGTPHVLGENALVDQTRGLVSAIEATKACHPRAFQDRGISVACVASCGIQGKFLTTDISELVAASSYGPLSGNWTNVGDGIVPFDLAFLEDPAERILVDQAEHIHVLPTPWNLWDASAPSIRLELESYFSRKAMTKWTSFIR